MTIYRFSIGVLFLEFDREACSEEDAILSATRDIIERGGKVNLVTWDKPQTFNLPTAQSGAKGRSTGLLQFKLKHSRPVLPAPGGRA